MIWEEAMEEAREELGYYPDEYINDWEELVETAREIYDYNKQKEYEEFCINAHIQYKQYLNSNRWKKLRFQILNRDNFICQDCGNKAIDVHHLDYDYLGTSKESKFCISLCRECHKRRHNIKSSNHIQLIEPMFNIHIQSINRKKNICPECGYKCDKEDIYCQRCNKVLKENEEWLEY
jgi:hypothetical protein